MKIRFGTDGWRGIVGDDFTYETLRYAAQGIADYVLAGGERRLVVVGYDCRFASEAFASEVAMVFAGNALPSLLFDRATPTIRVCLRSSSRMRLRSSGSNLPAGIRRGMGSRICVLKGCKPTTSENRWGRMQRIVC